MPDLSEHVAIGKLGRPHGVRGEIRVFPFNPNSETITEGLEVYLECDGDGPLATTVEQARYTDRFIITKFEDIDDRDVVDEFKHGRVFVDYDDLPKLDDDEFYYVDLVGAPVYVADTEDGDITEDDEPIGVVDRFFATGANDVLVVDRDDSDDLYAPLVEHAVSLLDFERQLIVLQPLEIWAPADDEE